MSKDTRNDIIVYIIVNVIFAVTAFVFIRLAFFVPQVCDLDKEFVWCHTHPVHGLGIPGMILFCSAFISVTGIWRIFTGTNPTNQAGAITFISAVAGWLGMGLIFLS